MSGVGLGGLVALGLLVPLWGRPRRDAEGALTVLARAGRICYAASYTGLDTVAGISTGTVAGGEVHEVVGRLFAAGDELGRASGPSAMLGFAVGYGLPAPAASQPDDARSVAGRLTNP
ncbi:hypothetical protein ACIQMV_32770 [Streptomyces sp. NPDC091412]|uniref:hypothetical protein n=1 Tax=Streptomyces sp. NPDC091412 TaxID=3366002 RepID=UPI0038088455